MQFLVQMTVTALFNKWLLDNAARCRGYVISSDTICMAAAITPARL
jgi:hypothetical protein